jgi:vacuolar-type H+-ATPase subunit D/Vma8
MKIKEEQLKKIQDQQKELESLITGIGLLEARKHSLLHEISDKNKDIESTKHELESEYGAINIDMQTGEFTKLSKEDIDNLKTGKTPELKVLQDAE